MSVSVIVACIDMIDTERYFIFACIYRVYRLYRTYCSPLSMYRIDQYTALLYKRKRLMSREDAPFYE